MSLADNIALPSWALNQEGHALVERIIAERPERRIRRHRLPSIYGGHADGTSSTYAGETAGRLRRMHDDWLTREFAALDAQYHATGQWDQDASNALHRTEDGNQLIERALRETANVVPYTSMSITERPDGSAQVAA